MIEMLMIFQIVVAVLLVVMVLLQFGKGAEAGLMGGGASDSVFTGAQRGNILSKITIVLSILFLGGSINLARLQALEMEESVMSDELPVVTPLTPKTEENKAEKKGNPSKK